MKKKLIAVITAAMALLSAFQPAMAENDKVEISFKVGDSILSINGVDTEVETPYVAGDGTTLVPLRVITEAFGAQVDWEGETQTITLKYPDVNIVLQIGNIVAKVNDHSETLLEAPALSQNGVTMVPLRFISETFGATVGYDNDTQAILVTQEKIDDKNTVTGITDMTKTGDSYYQWSIDTPRQMQMTDRRLDGLSTTFSADDGSKLYIDVYKRTKDTITPFDEEFAKVKDSFSNYTLTEAEKLEDTAGNKYMHFQAKDKEEIVDFCEYYGKDYTTYDVIAYIKINDDTAIKDMILSLSGSFKLGSIDNQTYDLSNVEDNMRTIKDDTYKVSFKIPADFMQSTSSNADNEFIFFSPDENSPSGISFAIYSKTADVTAESLAHNDHDSRVKSCNPEFSTISDVENIGNNTYRYTHTISGSSDYDSYEVDTFFEKGEYVYNMLVSLPSNDNATVEKILSSLQTEELDFSKVGKLLRNDPDDETMSTNKIGTSYTIDLPSSWKSSISAMDSAAFVSSRTGSMIAVTIDSDSSHSKNSLSSDASSYLNYLKKNPDVNVIKNITYETVNNERYATFTYTRTSDSGSLSYITVYMKTSKSELIMLSLYEKDVYYHADGNETFLNAIASLTKK